HPILPPDHKGWIFSISYSTILPLIHSTVSTIYSHHPHSSYLRHSARSQSRAESFENTQSLHQVQPNSPQKSFCHHQTLGSQPLPALRCIVSLHTFPSFAYYPSYGWLWPLRYNDKLLLLLRALLNL